MAIFTAMPMTPQIVIPASTAMPPGVFTVPQEAVFNGLPPLDDGTKQSRRKPGLRGSRGQGRPSRRKPETKDLPAVTPLYKTRLCNFFAADACQKGSSCPYAHGPDELRTSPDFERTSVCPVLLSRGTCDREGCRYAHSANELRIAPGLLKTKMCSFHLAGICVVGQACRFAHSSEELQEAVAMQKELISEQPAPKKPKEELWEQRRNAFAGTTEASSSSSARVVSSSTQDITIHVPQELREAAAGALPSGSMSSMPLQAAAAALQQAAQQLLAAAAAPTAQAADLVPGTGLVLQKTATPHSRQISEGELSVPEQSSKLATVEDSTLEHVSHAEQFFPARVVGGRVLIQFDEADEDLLPSVPMTTVETLSIPKLSLSGINTPESTPSSPLIQALEALPPPSIDQAKSRGRSGAVKPLRNQRMPSKSSQRVVVDIEDVDVLLEGTCNKCQTRPSSADPPLVELRRRAGNCVVPTLASGARCGLSKALPSPCGFSGRFAECALCPRNNHQAHAQGGGVACAACNCGLKVVARNTFLTFAKDDGDDSDDMAPGARRRTKSE